MEIAVIGAAGKMGLWFTNHFLRRGFGVSMFDVNRQMPRTSGKSRVSESLEKCVRDADFVLISVPVHITPSLIKQCAKNMKAGAIISEISSVKYRAFRALEKVPVNLRPLCIHPMFGPGARDDARSKMLLVPVRDEEAELKIVHDIFENAEVKVLPNSKIHDKSIATVLGLTYFANIVFAKVVSEGDIPGLKQVSGTTFGLQSLLAESILTNEPDLVTALIRENPYAKTNIKRYIEEASALAKMVSAKDSDRLKTELRKVRTKLQKWQDLQQSYKRMYDIIENLK